MSSDKTTGLQQVRAYDWRSVSVPDLGTDVWAPTLSVSVIIPAFDAQEKLDRTLAALGAQRYPSSLLEVVVVDDGSPAPLKLSERAPAATRMLRMDRSEGWGPARARHAGAMAAEGDILLFLDADMVAFPDHVGAHARWHHVLAEGVTLGHKLFVEFDGISAADVAEAAARDELFELCGDRPHSTHDWIERLWERTDQLTSNKPELFTSAVTATIAMRASLYREAGGFRTELHAGEDMELGYRLMTAGAVFIPESAARSWHQGSATFMSKAAEVRRRNNPNFANYIPIPGAYRPWTPGRQYAVPMIDVIVPTMAASYEATKHCVDAVLAAELLDLRVELCCPVEGSEADLLRAQYQDDPRVLVRPDLPDTGFPSRFTALMAEWVGLPPTALSQLVELLEADGIGLIHVVLPGARPDDGSLTLWRTAALHRARRAADGSEPVEAIAGRLFGERWVDAAQLGVVDLRTRRLPAPPKRQPSLATLHHDLETSREQLKVQRRKGKREAQARADLQQRQERLEREHKALSKTHKRLKKRRLVRWALKLDALKRRIRRALP